MLFNRLRLISAEEDINTRITTSGINPSISLLAIFREKK
jgi:hypothetical protein